MPISEILETCTEKIIDHGKGPIIMRSDALLKVLETGYILIQRNNLSAAWILKQDRTRTGYNVNRQAVRQLVHHHLIDKVDENITTTAYKINKKGLEELEKEEKRKNHLFITEKKQPKITPELSLDASIIKTDKEEYIITLLIKNNATLKIVKEKLGIQELSVPSETVREIRRDTTQCYYCKAELQRQAIGRKPWRIVCQSEECREKYAGDFQTKNEMIEQGISIE